MNEPVTSIDPRFSDPGTVATPWDETRRVLETAELFWLSTVRADGRPHMTPLVAVWFNGALYFCTGATEQKTKNLQEHAHVILMTGCNDWEKGIDVIVEGTAVQITDQITDNDLLQRLTQEWGKKWDGRWQYEGRDGGLYHKEGGMALVFEVKPTKILAFTKGIFTHTRHRF